MLLFAKKDFIAGVIKMVLNYDKSKEECFDMLMHQYLFTENGDLCKPVGCNGLALGEDAK
jgi:3-hydroxyacyl-CoA dehydrogenase/enoyl-CoA hydratase/3-hydroxybutyryl-CoA epimerase